MTSSAPARPRGPAAGGPPVLADPRRWGSLVGLAGGLLFVAAYSPALGAGTSAVALAVGVALVLVALVATFVRPVPLGPLDRPRPLALAVYGGCVVGEIVLIAAGSGALAAAGRDDLQPAVIAAAVGLHFLPFAWAFGERMFLVLGGAVAAIGAGGLGAGWLGAPHAADASGVLAGLAMLVLITRYARGGFVRPRLGSAET